MHRFGNIRLILIFKLQILPTTDADKQTTCAHSAAAISFIFILHFIFILFLFLQYYYRNSVIALVQLEDCVTPAFDAIHGVWH